MRIAFTMIACSVLAGGTATLQAQQALRPAPSGRATSEVVLTRAVPAGSDAAAGPELRIRVDHGQPHLRGRQLHTDSLVPYGTPWRTGANAATSLTTDVALELAGIPLPAGRYVLFTLPGRDGWRLLVQRDAGQEGMYQAEHDLAAGDLRVRQRAEPLESLTMWLIPSTAEGSARGEFRIAWGTTELATDWIVLDSRDASDQ